MTVATKPKPKEATRKTTRAKTTSKAATSKAATNGGKAPKAKAKQEVNVGETKDVTLTVERPKERRCHFPCPACEHRVYVARAKPRGSFKTQCRGCRQKWVNEGPFEDDKAEEQKAGQTWKLTVKAVK